DIRSCGVAGVQHLAGMLQCVAEDVDGRISTLQAQPEGCRIEEFFVGLDGLEFGHDGRAWAGSGIQVRAGMVSSERRVSTSQPLAVTARVCSHWAERRRSRVVTVQPSARDSLVW